MSKRWDSESLSAWQGCIYLAAVDQFSKFPRLGPSSSQPQPCKSTGAVSGCSGYQGQTQGQHQPFAVDGDQGLGCHFQHDTGKWRLSTVPNVSHSSPCPGYLGLICFVFEFHYDCCSLGAVLEGWLSVLVRTGIPCAWPCTSSRVDSPGAHHPPANAGSLLLH